MYLVKLATTEVHCPMIGWSEIPKLLKTDTDTYTPTHTHTHTHTGKQTLTNLHVMVMVVMIYDDDLHHRSTYRLAVVDRWLFLLCYLDVILLECLLKH